MLYHCLGSNALDDFIVSIHPLRLFLLRSLVTLSLIAWSRFNNVANIEGRLLTVFRFLRGEAGGFTIADYMDCFQMMESCYHR
jgi:hypothetical protein